MEYSMEFCVPHLYTIVLPLNATLYIYTKHICLEEKLFFEEVANIWQQAAAGTGV